jgi:glutathione-regulated potassium-efflux system protein KefB
MRGNAVTPQPAPYVKPRREGQALNEEAAEALEGEDGREKVGA